MSKTTLAAILKGINGLAALAAFAFGERDLALLFVTAYLGGSVAQGVMSQDGKPMAKKTINDLYELIESRMNTEKADGGK